MYCSKGFLLKTSKLCAQVALCLAVFQAPSEAQSLEKDTAPISSGSISGALTDLFEGGQLESEMQRNQQQNAAIANSVTPEVIRDSQSKLPRIDKLATASDFLGKIKYGTHNTVSKNGEQVITLIRSLTTEPLAQRDHTLRQLQSLAKENNPEALNFIGFVVANGLFGATKNQARAVEYFKTAAAANYQPAIYNLALDAAYSVPTKESLVKATSYINRAANVDTDNSFRICGFASFLYYRQGDLRNATHYTQQCGSALNGLPLALANNSLQLSKRIDLLRTSISTGVDDGYPLLERLTRTNANNDNQYLYCKYTLLNRLRLQPQLSLNDFAARCYDQFTHLDPKLKIDANRRGQAISGITSFASIEKTALDQLRTSNHFHYAWSVPYLPFPQQDVDLFSPLFPK